MIGFIFLLVIIKVVCFIFYLKNDLYMHDFSLKSELMKIKYRSGLNFFSFSFFEFPQGYNKES